LVSVSGVTQPLQRLRNQHVVANKNLNPTAFKILWDQNERMNINKSGTTDDYEIKYYLDFYEYFN